VTESLGELLAELAEFLAPEMKRAGVELRLVVEEDAPDVPVDESLARQAFLNLMRNAREAMADGGHLVVRVERDEEGGALVTVEDDGPGIPEAVRANVFDPFFTTKQRGTGLGLAVTREIVEAHRGTITCEPRSPHGTIFRLRFPEGSRAR
jgi:signal transduction histidine kinase